LNRLRPTGRYFGEIDLRFEYDGRSGPTFSVLHVDYDTFARTAEKTGWTSELIREAGGHCLHGR
jgi:hypothetical protein